MNFLSMVVAFLSMFWLAWFSFTQLESSILGIASLGAMILVGIMSVLAVIEDR